MNRSKFDALALVEQLNILGDLREPPVAGLYAAIERRVISMIRGGRLQEIADACAFHQTIYGLNSVDSKVNAMGGVYDVEDIKKWPEKHTWHVPAINPIRRLHELGEYTAFKSLSKFFTGFTPSGMVIGSNPKEYGREMERIGVGSGLNGIAAEGEDALFFSLNTKKAFNDVMKLYGKSDCCRHSQPLIDLMNSDQAPLDNIAIWSGEFMKASDYLVDSLAFTEKLAKPLYAGEHMDKVVDDYLQGTVAGDAKRLNFWFANLSKDKSQVPALQRSVLGLFNKPVDSNPELFVNSALMNLHLALSQISEAVSPGSQQKTLYGLIMGQLGISINYNGAYGLYCDLADSMIDRKSLIDGLDATRVKSLHAKLKWEECLPNLSINQRGKVFSQELGV